MSEQAKSLPQAEEYSRWEKGSKEQQQLEYNILKEIWDITHSLTPTQRNADITSQRLFCAYYLKRDQNGNDFQKYIEKNKKLKNITNTYITNRYNNAKSFGLEPLCSFFGDYLTDSPQNFDEFIKNKDASIVRRTLDFIHVPDPKTHPVITFQHNEERANVLDMHITRVTTNIPGIIRKIREELADIRTNGIHDDSISLNEITYIQGMSFLINEQFTPLLKKLGFTKPDTEFSYIDPNQEIKNLQKNHSRFNELFSLGEVLSTAFANIAPSPSNLKTFLQKGELPHIGVMTAPIEVLIPKARR